MTRALSVAAALCLLLAAAQVWASVSDPGGYLVDADGKRVKVERFLDLLPQFFVEYRDELLKIPMHDIKSIVRTKDGLRVTNRSGKIFEVQADLIVSMTGMLKYLSRDPITGQLGKQEMDSALVNQIGFDWGKK